MSVIPDMLSHMGGVPIASAAYTNPWTTAYFVDADNGSVSAAGKSPDNAVTTISKAITLASAGDIIYVRTRPPNPADLTEPLVYAENLVIPVAKYGMSIVGTGNNPHNPFFTMVKFADSGYGVDIYAPSTTIENMAFNRNSATTGMIYFRSASSTTDMAWGCLISHCHIRNANGKANAGIQFFGGSYNVIYKTIFEGCHTGIHIWSSGFPLRNLVIDGCTFHPSNATAVSGCDIDSTGGSVCYELEIKNCYFMMVPSGNGFINLTGAGFHGNISNCYFGDGDIAVGTAGDIAKPATVFISGCYDDDVAQPSTT